MAFELHSTSFRAGENVPVEHTCDGDDRSPPLGWTGTPKGTLSLALIVHDPDAPRGDWVHWVLFDLPATTTELGEGQPAARTLPSGGHQGRNDFGRIGYGGPCPPPGPAHRYVFELYALDAPLDLEPGCTRDDVETAMRGHMLGRAELMGRYARAAKHA